MFQTMLHDNVKAREQISDGKYKKVKNGQKALNSQEFFYEQALHFLYNSVFWNVNSKFLLQSYQFLHQHEMP